MVYRTTLNRRGRTDVGRATLFAKGVLDDAYLAAYFFTKSVVLIVGEVAIVEEEVVVGYSAYCTPPYSTTTLPAERWMFC